MVKCDSSKVGYLDLIQIPLIDLTFYQTPWNHHKLKKHHLQLVFDQFLNSNKILSVYHFLNVNNPDTVFLLHLLKKLCIFSKLYADSLCLHFIWW